MKRGKGWRTAYNVSLPLFLAGILLCLFGGQRAALAGLGAGLVMLGGVIRFVWCRCPHCGAPMMLVRGDTCPRCREKLDGPDNNNQQ